MTKGRNKSSCAEADPTLEWGRPCREALMAAWKMKTRCLSTLAMAAVWLIPGLAEAQSHDSAFTALQERGRTVMGVDQYTSTHRFDDLPNGGRIELQRDGSDSAGVRAIRVHLAQIARAFAAGDFTLPGMVHARDVPGTRTLTARRESIVYEFRPLPGGGEVRITTSDPDARKAIHTFLAFQRREHRASGDDHRH
jgi:hypothetical protein